MAKGAGFSQSAASTIWSRKKQNGKVVEGKRPRRPRDIKTSGQKTKFKKKRKKRKEKCTETGVSVCEQTAESQLKKM